MQDVGPEQLPRAARRGDTGRVRELWSQFYSHYLLANHNGMARAILLCHPRAADAMMVGLRAAAQASEAKTFRGQLFLACHTDRERIKIFSVLHAAGFDLAPETTFAFSGPVVRDHLQKLAYYRSSNHARLEELRLEPDPAKLIARPLGEAFHGTVPGSSRFDIDYVQPFLGRWRRLPEELRSLCIGLPLASAAFATILMLMPD